MTTRTAGGVLLLLFVLAFLGLDRGLWTPDEPREAAISREMLLSPGIIPTLNGAMFAEKPPLYYWTVAAVFRAAGGPSAQVARAVSAACGFLTLLVVVAWGRRAHSLAAGVIAAIMLATAFQFGLSTHWVLIDPLLMLFTTLACWAAWELVRGGAGRLAVAGFYGAVALALWTKGLIGPVLLGAGLGLWFLLQRRSPWGPLRLGIGILAGLLAVGSMVAMMYAAGGREVVYEWGWVNQVLRFVAPKGTGHDQPFHYYLWTLPFAMLPWLVPLGDLLRPARWRTEDGGTAFYRFCLVMAAGMLLVLSAAATKRGIYLLPVLPLLFLAAAVNVLRWHDAHEAGAALGRPWGIQAGLLAVYALAPPVAALVYLRQALPAALLVLAVAIGLCGLMLAAARLRRPVPALAALAACAVVATGCTLVLVPRVLDQEKNMAPFVAWVDRQLPPGVPVYAIGADETLRAIVPFTTGRSLLPGTGADLAARTASGSPLPDFVLIQSKNSRTRVIEAGPAYRLLDSRRFGPDRQLALWQRLDRDLPGT